MEEKSFRHIIRIANTDLDGNKAIARALTKIRGISFMFANTLCNLTGIDKNKKTGNLDESEIKKIESTIADPVAAGAPSWILNRQRDPEEGIDKHLTGSNLKFTSENDIKMMRKIKCYRGIRHSFGLPVRGQRTRSNFRRNKGKVMGVAKKKAKPGKK